ncbi:MAG: hypothetical protein HY301_08960 [Verrucomicrobia bacterium]|nr:hypothetical protein [Verrucomicrobiota bacterium]
MGATAATAGSAAAPLVTPGWAKKLPLAALVLGAIGVLAGLFNPDAAAGKAFAFSYLTAYMFFLSLCLGGFFLTLLHHLFDAQWSVATRRLTEHLACLLPVMAVLWIPIGLKAKTLYAWMSHDPHSDPALAAKLPLFTVPAFYLTSVIIFALWTLWSFKLRANSLAQDRDGAAKHTQSNRKWAASGIFIFAFSLTLAAIFWMKALQHQFFSTMYGVYYFAGSVWATLGTLYLITLYLQRSGPLAGIATKRTFKDIATLLFAFTVFYAYIHFSQYFLIWNAAMPEETFWYYLREQGTWWDIGMLIVFGHFVVPFLSLLRIDAKHCLPLMIPLCAWTWLCHYADMAYNVQPVLYPDGFHFGLFDAASLLFIGGALATAFIKYFNAHPPFPQRDPRVAETMGVYVPPASH